MARAQELEQALSHDSRIVVLGTHLQSDTLMLELESTPEPCLLLDSALADSTALELLYRLMMTRPCPVVVLASPDAGEFAMEAIRAGALDCIAWEADDARVGELVEALVRAKQTPLFPLRMDGVLSSSRAARQQIVGEESHRVLALLGTRRAKLVCDVAEYLPSTFAASVLCQEPLHASLQEAFGRQVGRRSVLQVKQEIDRERLESGHLYLLGWQHELEYRGGSLILQERLETGGWEGVEEGSSWLGALLQGLVDSDLRLTLIVGGYLKPAEAKAARQLVEAGAGLARTIPEGFQVRWPNFGSPLRLSPRSFWNLINEYCASPDEEQLSSAKGGEVLSGEHG